MITQKNNYCLLRVYIQPNASKNEVIGLFNGALKIKIKAPPIDGKANEEVISFLSEELNLAKKYITIDKGQTGRNKLVKIENLNIELIKKALEK